MKDKTFLCKYHHNPGDVTDDGNGPVCPGCGKHYREYNGAGGGDINIAEAIKNSTPSLSDLDDENNYESLQDSFSDNYGSEERW